MRSSLFSCASTTCLIFVTDTTDGVSGEKIGQGEKFSPWHVSHMINLEKLCHMGKFLHMRNVETNLSSGKFLHMRKVEKICHVEKFLNMRKVAKIFHVEKFISPAYLSSTELICHLLQHHKMNILHNLWCFVAFYVVLLQNLSFKRFTLFSREICFVAIYALWRGENLGQKFGLWRKKDKYQVWSTTVSLI